MQGATLPGSRIAAVTVQRSESGAGAAPMQRRASGQLQRSVIAGWVLAVCWLYQDSVNAADTPSDPTIIGPIGATLQPLLPPLSTYVQPGAYFGTNNASLGNTTFR